MVDPKNYREVAIDLDAFKREVAPQFAHLNKMLQWVLAVLIGAAASGGFAIYTLMTDLKVGFGALSEKVTGLDKRIEAVEKRMEATAGQTPKDVTESLQRIERRLALELGPYAPLALTDSEVNLVRELLNFKGPLKGPPGFTIGDPIIEAALKPIPETLSEKVPRLRGAKYLLNNGYAILTGAGNRAIAILPGVE
jgi:hypothetical protein